MRRITAALIVLTGFFANMVTAHGQYGDYRGGSPAELSGRITFDSRSSAEPLSLPATPYAPRQSWNQPLRISRHASTPSYSPAPTVDEPDVASESSDAGSDRPYCCGGGFLTARFGTLILNRSHPHNETLFFDAFTPTQAINANQFNPGWAAGFEASLIWHDWKGPGTDLEARFFGVDDWSSVQTLTTTGVSVIINNNPQTAIVGPRTITSDFSSNLYSREVISHAWNEDRTFGYLFGGRSIQLNEDLNTQFVPDPAAGLADFRYDVATRNYLYGGQIGIEFALIRNCCSCWDGYLKGGLMANYANNESVATSLVAPPGLFPANNTAWNLAYIAEAGVTGRQKITDNWSLYLGYMALYIDGVALATEQIHSTDVGSATGLNHSAGVFYHGGRIGLEYNF